MKILFLHGLRENYQDNLILNSLKSFTNHTIIAPRLDPWHPIDTLNQIKDIIADLCIGFSLGGLFAMALDISKKFLINPALAFTDILRERRRPKYEQIEEYESFPIFIPEQIKAIFTTEDEKIGLRSLPIYLRYFSKDTITYLSGGHNLTKEQIINYVL